MHGLYCSMMRGKWMGRGIQQKKQKQCRSRSRNRNPMYRRKRKRKQTRVARENRSHVGAKQTYSVVSVVMIGFNPSFFLFLLIAAVVAAVIVADALLFEPAPFVAVAVVMDGVDAVAIAGVIVGAGASSR
jgi:hypothetical protein